MPYKVTVNRLDGSPVNGNSVIDRRTPKAGELIRVKCSHDVINARAELIVERSDADWVTASEAE